MNPAPPGWVTAMCAMLGDDAAMQMQEHPDGWRYNLPDGVSAPAGFTFWADAQLMGKAMEFFQTCRQADARLPDHTAKVIMLVELEPEGYAALCRQ